MNIFHVNVKVLQADGSVYAVCVNAATLAVMDAGIAMKDIVCACTAADLGFSSGEGSIPAVDVSKIDHVCNVVTLTYLPKTEKIVQIETLGRLHQDRLSELLAAATKGCQDLHVILDSAIREHVKKLASSIESSA